MRHTPCKIRGSGYGETTYGLVFEPSGQRATVSSGGWSLLQVSGNAYYLWGSAAERKLNPGTRPMPDYVGGWLDLGIIRAR